MHAELKRLAELRANITPGVWGPTTAPPKGKGEPYNLAQGERGKPGWGAVVAASNGRPGIDHPRYANTDRFSDWEEQGADYYGGTLVCESLSQGNGEYIAAMHATVPGMLETIRNLRAMVVSVGVNEDMVDQIIADSMKGLDPVDPA